MDEFIQPNLLSIMFFSFFQVSQILYDDTFFEGTFPEEIRTFNDAFRENTENMEDRGK